MSYDKTANLLAQITQGGMNSTVPALWIYVSTDSDLSGGYFTDGVQRGLKLNDLVMGIDTSGNTTKMYRVAALAAFSSTNPRADRAATLSAGTAISS